MLKNFKKVVSLVLVLTLSVVISLPAFAATHTSSNKLTINLNQTLTSSQKEFLQKYEKILGKFQLAQDNSLVLNISDKDLKEKYSFDDHDLNQLHKVIKESATLNKNYNKTKSSGGARTNVFVSGSTVYFTNEDVNAFLFAAASSGPDAMIAALDLLDAITDDPVAAIITTIIGVIGAPSVSNFCYQVIQAEANGEGVYIGVQFNGAFPNIVSGTWS